MNNGAPNTTLVEPSEAHDIIDFFANRKDAILKKCAHLSEKGLSYRNISHLTGLPESSLRQVLQKNNILPPKETRASNTSKYNRKGSLSTPPFGYSVIQGKLVINPQEYETVLTIMDFWKSGKTTYAIAKTLDEKNIPPRRSKKWCRKTISTIIKREKAKELDPNTDSVSGM